VAAARGALIAFHDSDDEWLLDKLDRQMRLFETLDDSHVAVYCAKIVCGRDAAFDYRPRAVCSVPGPDDRNLSGDLAERTLVANVIGPPVLLVKKEAFEAAGGFDPSLRNNEDWDFALRLTRLGPIGYVDAPLYVTHLSADSISRATVASARSFIRILGKLRRTEAEPLPPSLYNAAGAFLMRLGRPKAARRFYLRGWRVAPGRLGGGGRVLMTYAPALWRLRA
jgi:hypothetical protein